MMNCSKYLAVLSRDKPVSLPEGKVREIEDFQTKDYPGKVTPVTRVDLIPQVNREILELGFKNSEIVRAGQLLCRLDPVKYKAYPATCLGRLETFAGLVPGNNSLRSSA